MEHIANLNWLDYSILGIIAVSIVIGLVRGFIREALSIVSWIAAFWVGFTFSGELSSMMKSYITSDQLRIVIAFFILFAIVLILGALVNFILSQFVKKTGLSGTDRMLGLIFGIGRGVLLIAVILLVASATTMPKASWWKESVLLPHFQPVASWLKEFLPETIKSDTISHIKT